MAYMIYPRPFKLFLHHSCKFLHHRLTELPETLYLQKKSLSLVYVLISGAYPVFGRGGARIIFFRLGNFCMSLVRGVRGHAPPPQETFFLNGAIW